MFVDKATIITSAITTLAVTIGSITAVYQIIKQRKDRLNEFKYLELEKRLAQRMQLLHNVFISLKHAGLMYDATQRYDSIVINKMKELQEAVDMLDLGGGININATSEKCTCPNEYKKLINKRVDLNDTIKAIKNNFSNLLQSSVDDYFKAQSAVDNYFKAIKDQNFSTITKPEFIKIMLKLREMCKSDKINKHLYQDIINLEKHEKQYIEYQYKNGFKDHVKCKACRDLEPANND